MEQKRQQNYRMDEKTIEVIRTIYGKRLPKEGSKVTMGGIIRECLEVCYPEYFAED